MGILGFLIFIGVGVFVVWAMVFFGVFDYEKVGSDRIIYIILLAMMLLLWVASAKVLF